MNIDEAFKVAGAILTSIGGAVVIMGAFSGWLGKVWANRILEKDKLKYSSELEAIKTELQRESERQKVTFSLYFEGQFKLYNELWIALSDLQNEVDKLWFSASPENMRSFVRSVQKAKKQIRNSALLIEKSHYERILESLHQFESYQVGKDALINGSSVHNLSNFEIDEIIERNRYLKDQITEFTEYMLDNMRNQIRGK
ncbi:TPA: hypothetical protein ACN35N_003563 [Vibrio parahaemolyticus]